MLNLISKNVSELKIEFDGHTVNVPKNQVEFDEKTSKLSIPRWLYNEKFPNEKN